MEVNMKTKREYGNERSRKANKERIIFFYIFLWALKIAGLKISLWRLVNKTLQQETNVC